MQNGVVPDLGVDRAHKHADVRLEILQPVTHQREITLRVVPKLDLDGAPVGEHQVVVVAAEEDLGIVGDPEILRDGTFRADAVVVEFKVGLTTRDFLRANQVSDFLPLSPDGA